MRRKPKWWKGYTNAEKHGSIGKLEPTYRLLNTKKDKEEFRNFVLDFDYKCEECGEGDPAVLCVHHVIPIRKGGYDGLQNIKILCRNCHARVHAAARTARKRDIGLRVLELLRVGDYRRVEMTKNYNEMVKEMHRRIEDRGIAHCSFCDAQTEHRIEWKMYAKNTKVWECIKCGTTFEKVHGRRI